MNHLSLERMGIMYLLESWVIFSTLKDAPENVRGLVENQLLSPIDLFLEDLVHDGCSDRIPEAIDHRAETIQEPIHR